jgi:Cu+-exporting ATPase
LSEKTTITKCHYCGNACDSDVIVVNNTSYCCYGCATLDDVVAKLKTTAGDVSIKYKQFDLPENFSKLVDYEDQDRYSISISLPAIHCSSCIELLEDLPSFIDGILASNVNFERKRCKVTAKKSIPLSYVAQLLDDIGYPPQISLSQKLKEEEKKTQKNNLLKLAVAGFCFGNIMLYSMPHYFGLDVANDIFFSRLFSALSVLLTIPVLTYSGRDYLTSAYRALAAGKSHLNIPISIGILALFGWSLYEIFSGAGVGYLDSLAGLIFFLLVGKWFQYKVYDQVSYTRSVNEFIPLVVRKAKNTKDFVWERIDKLDKGDIIVVKSQEVIPAAGTLTRGDALINYAFVTGESIPVKVEAGSKVYAGGKQTRGDIAIALEEQPKLSDLWDTWSSETNSKEFNNRWTDHISKYFTLIVLLVAFTAGAIWWFINPAKAVFVFSSVLIVACPCALALSAPFTYGNILRVFSKNGFFVKAGNAIGNLSHITHIVFDKTGTLTESNSNHVQFIGKELTIKHQIAVATLAKQSTHPLSLIIANSLQIDQHVTLQNFEEHIGKGIEAQIGGDHYQLGSGSWLNGATATSTAVYLSINNELVGHFQIDANYRKGLKGVLDRLGRRYKLSIVSGDNASEENRLRSIYNGFKQMVFNCKPLQKANLIENLSKEDDVLMIGDGLNDGKAIEKGSLGVAITENLNGFYPGSDAVLLAHEFNKLPLFMELGYYSKKILRITLLFSLAYNVAGLTFAVAGVLTPIIAAILMPLSSISVVLLATLLVRNKAQKLKLI